MSVLHCVGKGMVRLYKNLLKRRVIDILPVRGKSGGRLKTISFPTFMAKSGKCYYKNRNMLL